MRSCCYKVKYWVLDNVRMCAFSNIIYMCMTKISNVAIARILTLELNLFRGHSFVKSCSVTDPHDFPEIVWDVNVSWQFRGLRCNYTGFMWMLRAVRGNLPVSATKTPELPRDSHVSEYFVTHSGQLNAKVWPRHLKHSFRERVKIINSDEGKLEKKKKACSKTN